MPSALDTLLQKVPPTMAEAERISFVLNPCSQQTMQSTEDKSDYLDLWGWIPFLVVSKFNIIGPWKQNSECNVPGFNRSHAHSHSPSLKPHPPHSLLSKPHPLSRHPLKPHSFTYHPLKLHPFFKPSLEATPLIKRSHEVTPISHSFSESSSSHNHSLLGETYI